ncbi:MAG: alginate O-acetyltransferase AlgX-related protein [Alphaproteobacteria bacterium]
MMLPTEPVRKIERPPVREQRPPPAKSLEGKNGWFFLDNDTNQVVDQITGKKRIEGAPLEKWKKAFKGRSAALQEKKIPYVFMVAPNKHAVYDEHLPDHVTPSSRRPVYQLQDIAKESKIPFFYPLSTLKKGKKNGAPYYKTDTHWNDYGAFLAYASLMRGISVFCTPRILKREDITVTKTVKKEGDLVRTRGKEQEETVPFITVRNKQTKTVFSNYKFNTGRIFISENTDQSLPSVVIFGDSFSLYMSSFLSESFRRVFWVHQAELDYNLIAQENPDIVISIMVERFITTPPEDRAEDVPA